MGPILRGREWRDLRHLAAGVWPRVIGRFVGCPGRFRSCLQNWPATRVCATTDGAIEPRGRFRGQRSYKRKKPALLSGLFVMLMPAIT
jgi:hypothetical protein